MNIVIIGSGNCPRAITARVIAEAARVKYGAFSTEIITLDPDNMALIADAEGHDIVGILQMAEALLSRNAECVFVMDDEGLGRFLGYFPGFDLGRIHNLNLDTVKDYPGDTNDPEYFIEIFDSLAPALIRQFMPGPKLQSNSEVFTETEALWYFIFSTVFD